VRHRASLGLFVCPHANVETRTSARLDETRRDQAIVGFHDGRAADAGFFGAIADRRQPRAGPQRVVLDALRETRGELGGQAVVLLGLLEGHI
jgi:hypothetical protein